MRRRVRRDAAVLLGGDWGMIDEGERDLCFRAVLVWADCCQWDGRRGHSQPVMSHCLLEF